MKHSQEVRSVQVVFSLLVDPTWTPFENVSTRDNSELICLHFARSFDMGHDLFFWNEY